MRIFDIAFNPKKDKNRFFDSYSYEPGNAAERSRGSLFVIGEFSHALEFQGGFLRMLAKSIQQGYYGSLAKTPGEALESALSLANGLLRRESEKGNTGWLGNLHVAALSLVTAREKRKDMYLGKTGSVSVCIARKNRVIELEKELAGDSVSAFGAIASGSLFAGDAVFLLTRGVRDILLKEGSLRSLAGFQDQKGCDAFLLKRKKAFSSVSGLLFQAIIEDAEKLAPERKTGKKKQTGFEFSGNLALSRLRVPFFAANMLKKAPALFQSQSPIVQKRLILLGTLVLLLGFGILIF